MSHPGRPLVLSTLLLLALIWGTTWAAIRIGLEGIPPFAGVALRFAIASVLLFLLGRFYGVRYGTSRRERVLWVVNGVLSFSVSYGVVYWCEQRVPSGLAAVLFATFPLFVAILARFALPEESSRATFAGVVLGFLGVALIFSEDLSKIWGPGVAAASALMLASPIVSAVASVAIKRFGKGIHPLSITAVPMAIGAALMGILAAVSERGRPLHFSPKATLALLYLAIAGSAVTFSLYYWLLSHIPATQVSLIAYLSPVVAVTVGALVLHEPYTLRMLLGSALVVGGVAVAALPLRRAVARAVVGGVLLCALLGAPAPVRAAETGLRLPEDPAPPAVRALGPLEHPVAFALAADGGVAAATLEGPEKKTKKSIVRIGTAESAVREIEVEGSVRALRFAPSGGTLYVIASIPPTRLGSAVTRLHRFDPDSAKPKRGMLLPIDAHEMDLSAEGAALLVVGSNELRVILVPDLRSARLFRIPGENLSVAALAGSTRVLIGRKDEIELVDLSDPQARDGLPPHARVALPAPVVSLASSPDGTAALARVEDGRTWLVSVDPLEVRELGLASAIAWPGARIEMREAPPPPPQPAEAALPAETPPPVEVQEQPAAAPEPEPVTALPPPAPTPTPQAAPVAVQAEPPVLAAPSAAAPASEPVLRVEIRLPGAHGRVLGAIADVRGVVVLGPDNLLHEAARVRLAPDGTWLAPSLPPGKYRIVVDAGSDLVAITDPPFVNVTVSAEAEVVAPDLRIVSVRKP